MWGTTKRGFGATVVAVAAVLLPIAGCGDDGSSSEPETLAISVTEGEDGSSELTAPSSTAAGLTEITLTNEGERPHSGQLLRAEGEHDEAEVLEGLESAMRHGPVPEWLFTAGGTGAANPGETATATQELEAGSTYWLVDDEARGKPPMQRIEIEGEGGDGELPDAPQTVEAVEFGFEVDGALQSGESIRFENAGSQPHHMVAAPIQEGKTIDDVKAFVKDQQGEPPVDFEGGTSSSILEGGTSQVWEAELEAGDYALLCFISNREGGPPHVQLGMVDEVEVR